MKKTLIFLLVLSVIASMSLMMFSCGSEIDDVTAETEEVTTVEPTDPPTTAAPTDPPTTEEPTEPPVINYEIVKRYVFDNPDDIGWKVTNQIEDFRVEDGLLKLTSTGGDPYFTAIVPLDIAADEIDVIKIRTKNLSDDYNCQFFFDTDVEGGLSESKSYKDSYWNSGSAPDSDEWNDILIYTDDCDLWEGIIKTIRFDPLQSEGEIFIEYISFEKIIK